MIMSSKSNSSRTLQGIAVSPGIYIAKTIIYDPVRPIVPRRIISLDEVDLEKGILREGIEHARQVILDLRLKVHQTLDEAHASIFDPQLMVLDDPVIIERTMGRIEKFRENAAMAFMTVIQQFVDQFASLGDAYIASRNADILDVGNRVCQFLASNQTDSQNLKFADDVIILAPDLSPSDTAQMDHKHVRGFATELGGPTSHTAILAKALEIPAVVGLGQLIQDVRNGMLAIIDGYEGTVTLDPSPREIARARAPPPPAHGPRARPAEAQIHAGRDA